MLLQVSMNSLGSMLGLGACMDPRSFCLSPQADARLCCLKVLLQITNATFNIAANTAANGSNTHSDGLPTKQQWDPGCQEYTMAELMHTPVSVHVATVPERIHAAWCDVVFCKAGYEALAESTNRAWQVWGRNVIK